MIAIVVLSIAIVAVTLPLYAGYRNQSNAEVATRGVRLAEHLMAEITSRPYTGGGGSRLTWDVAGYHGLVEASGAIRDFTGDLYHASDQTYTRRATVVSSTVPMPGEPSTTIAGKSVTVTVEAAGGWQWTLTRFVPEPTP